MVGPELFVVTEFDRAFCMSLSSIFFGLTSKTCSSLKNMLSLSKLLFFIIYVMTSLMINHFLDRSVSNPMKVKRAYAAATLSPFSNQVTI